MEFSVVIPTYNRARLLRKTLLALGDQSISPRCYEVIIVDDGSGDETAGMVRHIRKAYPVPLHYFHQANRKQGAARNLGSRKASGDYLVFLGDDTVPIPDFLAQHRRNFPFDPHLVLTGYTPWAAECPSTRFMEYIGEKGWQFGFSLIEDPENLPFNFFYTSNLSIARPFFEESGGFDEEFQEYGWEDVELSLRLKKCGMRLAHNSKAIAYHHHPTSLASFVGRQRKVGYSAWLFYRKHPEMREFLSVLRVPDYTAFQHLKMTVLTWLCSRTEHMRWPDCSRYYPDLMSYYYNLGVLQARSESRLGAATKTTGQNE